MKSPLRIAGVPYLNALPLYEGLAELLPDAQLTFSPPTEVAKLLRQKQADIGLVPAFALLEKGMEHLVALHDLGIASCGEVLSVYVASRLPFSQTEEIYLDPESKTSSALTRILAPRTLGKRVRYLHTFPGYEKDIQGQRAGLLIGDRALMQRENFPHRLDLGTAWQEFTQLPMVFALWAIDRECATEAVAFALRAAMDLGESRRDRIASDWAKKTDASEVIAKRYLQEHIQYRLGPSEHEGLKRFIHLAIAMDMVHPQREIVFYGTTAHHRPNFGRKECIS